MRVGRAAAALMAVAAVLATPASPIAVPSATALAPAPSAPYVTTRFVPLSPHRLLDTRETQATLEAGTTVDLPITGRLGIPVDAAAVVLNVTATETAGPGFVTAFPTGTDRPTVSNLNPEHGGETISNLVTVPIGAGGSVSIYSHQRTDIVADVFGYYVPTSETNEGRFVSVGPTRAFDSRLIGGPLGAGGQTTVGLTGVPTDAIAAVLTVTVDQAAGPGFWTAFAAGTSRPDTSNVNVEAAGQTIANQVIVPISGDGVSIYSQTGGHVVVDVAGYFTGASAPFATDGLFVPLAPTRVVDTRGTLNPVAPRTRAAGGWTLEVPVATKLALPTSAAAVVATATIVDATEPGYLTLFPAGTERPTASNVNATRRGQNIPNHVVAPLASRGVAIYTFAGSHILLDVTGFFTGTPMRSRLYPAPNPATIAPAPPTHIRVARLGLDASVGEGIELLTLNEEPGYWPYTARPGENGNMVIGGHRTAHTRPFYFIDRLVPGDDIYVTSGDTTYRYQMTEAVIVAAEDFGAIVRSTSESTLTLFACNPLGSITQRYVVRAVYVGRT